MKLCNYCTQNTLMERIEQNYEDFKTSAVRLDGESLYELAPTIAAVEDVYFYMSTHDWADAEQTRFLMQFENPLKLLADLWEEENEDRGADFGDMLDRIGGGDLPIDRAILCEIAELGRKLFKY